MDRKGERRGMVEKVGISNETKRNIETQMLLAAMQRRMEALDKLIMRDYNGGLSTTLGKWAELKYWKEAIERGEFD